MKDIGELLYLIFCTFTAMIGFNIHESPFWAVVDFFFAPIVLVKWLIFKEINLGIIKSTFEFLLQN